MFLWGPGASAQKGPKRRPGATGSRRPAEKFRKKPRPQRAPKGARPGETKAERGDPDPLGPNVSITSRASGHIGVKLRPDAREVARGRSPQYNL